MFRSYTALTVAEGDESLALQLLTAVVMGWNLIPLASQVELVSETCRVHGCQSGPDEVMAFINRHRDRPL